MKRKLDAPMWKDEGEEKDSLLSALPPHSDLSSRERGAVDNELNWPWQRMGPPKWAKALRASRKSPAGCFVTTHETWCQEQEVSAEA